VSSAVFSEWPRSCSWAISEVKSAKRCERLARRIIDASWLLNGFLKPPPSFPPSLHPISPR